MVTIKMIAQRCGLSTAAVSRALNHLPGVSVENADRVRQIAKEMGYFPNEAARTLKTNRTKNIGVLYRNLFGHEFFSLMLEGIHQEAIRQGYELIFLSNATEMPYVDYARQRQCAGVIIVQSLFDQDSVTALVESELPTVALEESYTGITNIVSDNVEAMQEIIHYLHDELGHSRIAFIHGEVGQVTNERIAGFYRGCRNCGITVPDEYLRAAKFRTPYISGDITRELLALPKPPTCILYPDDISCLGGMTEIDRQGLRIPEAIGVLGFDGIALSRVVRPQLTTYVQDAIQMGTRATQEVINAIEEPRFYVPRTINLKGKLQYGGTVRSLKGGNPK